MLTCQPCPATKSHVRIPEVCAPCSAAQAANASGVVISAEPGSDVEQLGCDGRECDLPLSIWATMLPYHAALLIREVHQEAALPFPNLSTHPKAHQMSVHDKVIFSMLASLSID